MSRFSDAPLESDPLLPGVDAERCVHVQIEQASPAHAWVIDDTMLGIDSSRCDGCGLCAPVCPERAIEPLFRPLLLQTTKTRLALTICDRAAESCREPGWVPCLQAIGVVDLLLLRQPTTPTLLAMRTLSDQVSHTPSPVEKTDFFLGVSSTKSASRFKLSGKSHALMVDPRTDRVEYDTGFFPRLHVKRYKRK